MKFFAKAPDGGKGSGVTGYFLVEIKPLFSVVLLHFERGTREAYHEHAFNALTIWLKGRVREHHICGGCGGSGFTGRGTGYGDVCGECGGQRELPSKEFSAGHWKLTPRSTFHKIEALESTWAFSIRGPWVDRWREWRNGRFVTLTHGRREVA